MKWKRKKKNKTDLRECCPPGARLELPKETFIIISGVRHELPKKNIIITGALAWPENKIIIIIPRAA